MNVCYSCGKKLKISGSMDIDDWDNYGIWCAKYDTGKQKWLCFCEECYKIESEKDTDLELIKFIKGKTDKLCWNELDIVIEILEKRFEKENK